MFFFKKSFFDISAVLGSIFPHKITLEYFVDFLLKNLVLRHRAESQRAECKGAERHSAEFRENDKVPNSQIVNVIKCRTVKFSIF
jgi:hypothetical protein